MRGSRIALAVLCAAVLILTPASLPTRPSVLAQVTPGNQGLQGGWAIDNKGQVHFVHSSAQQFPIMQEAGAGWVRLNFRLGECFPNWTTTATCTGATALAAYNEVVNAALAKNLRIVGLISNESWRGTQAQWTANNAEDGGSNPKRTGDNTYIRDFASKASAVLAKQYAGKITHWEIWNEPNAYTNPDGVSGGSFIYPSNFAWLLKRSHAAVKAVQQPPGQPPATVISGGMFGHDPQGLTVSAVENTARGRVPENGGRGQVTLRGTLRGTRLERRPGGPAGPLPEAQRESGVAAAAACETVPSGADYLCSTYEMGIAKAGWTTYKSQNGTYPLDHVGQHLYVDQGGALTADKLRDTLGTHLSDIRGAYARWEGTGTPKKTQVTEVGWQTKPNYVTPEIQAQNLQTAFQTFDSFSYVARAFWFNVQDVPEGDLFHGLVDGDGGRKRAFGAYQTYAR